MKVALLSLSLLAACTTPGFAQATSEVGQPVDGSRIERSQAKQRALFGDVPSTTQPELMQVLRNLTYGDVYAIGNLDDKTRELVTLVVLTTNQNLPQIKAHTDAALNVGVSPIQIREALYQAAAFVGFPKVINALNWSMRFLQAGDRLAVGAKSDRCRSRTLRKGQGHSATDLWWPDAGEPEGPTRQPS